MTRSKEPPRGLDNYNMRHSNIGNGCHATNTLLTNHERCRQILCCDVTALRAGLRPVATAIWIAPPTLC